MICCLGGIRLIGGVADVCADGRQAVLTDDLPLELAQILVATAESTLRAVLQQADALAATAGDANLGSDDLQKAVFFLLQFAVVYNYTVVAGKREIHGTSPSGGSAP